MESPTCRMRRARAAGIEPAGVGRSRRPPGGGRRTALDMASGAELDFGAADVTDAGWGVSSAPLAPLQELPKARTTSATERKRTRAFWQEISPRLYLLSMLPSSIFTRR